MRDSCARCLKPITQGYARSLFARLICKDCLTENEKKEVSQNEQKQKAKQK